MIKKMQTDNIGIGLIPDEQSAPTHYDVIFTIKGEDNKLTVDELKEIIKVTQNFWEVNDLYRWTSEAMEERRLWEENDDKPKLSESMTGSLSGRSFQRNRL